MAASNRVIVLLLAFGCLSGLAPSAGAWSNGGYSADLDNPDYGTHDWIVDMALEMQTRDITFLKVTYHTELLLGTEAPDNPEFIGDTSNHHVYYSSAHALVDGAAADRADQIYQLALAYLEAGDYDSAAFDIGVMAHYIADPGVFGHTMGAATDWGAEIHHSDYENEFESRLDTLGQPTGISLQDSDAYDATLSLAETITFGSGPIKPNGWMDLNYSWSDPVFVTSAMSSLNSSVSAVASVINHLVIQAGSTVIPTPPTPPTNLYGSVDGLNVVLTWNQPLDDGGAELAGYSVYRRVDGGALTPVASVPSGVFGWIDDTVSRDETYNYSVTAWNSVGSSGFSNEVSVTIPPKKTSSLDVPLIASVLSVALASVGACGLIWRRRARRKRGRQ